jgi:eukaryotic-like serine/threonine-protein kinase
MERRQGLASHTDQQGGESVTPERWRRINELFLSTIELEPNERSDFLKQACTEDASLLKELELMLTSHEEATSFIETPAIESAASLLLEEQNLSMVGRRIGQYKVISELGRGGMGTVFLAVRDDDQYEKQVAIKLVSSSLNIGEMLRRFYNERQILANLDHPNIAKLLDGGTTEEGLPYLVMDYVDGIPIDTYCNTQHLSIREMLELFRKVCAAVHYAHQNLFVHRDIKPSNILVTREGVPKLLDFGIAKVIDSGRSVQQAGLTRTGLRPMTPEYASPEQVRGKAITTASDIYSLGVLLYKLLAGERPYNFNDYSQLEIERVICEEEPPRPGTIKRELSGDLDNIVMMAMRKSADRRYGSVEQLSEDICRHLEGLPVIARKDTFSYRTVKFIKRNRIAVAAAVLLAITLAAGVGATIWQARVARAAQARAERRFNEVRELANSYLFEFNDSIKDLPGSTTARQLLIKRALKYLDSLAQEAVGDPSLQRELAAAYLRLGDIQGNFFNANVGDMAGALESYRKAVAILEGLSEADPLNRQISHDLSTGYGRVGDMVMYTGNAAAALQSYRKAIPSLEALAADPANMKARRDLAIGYYRMGHIIIYNGDNIGAKETFKKAVELSEKLSEADPADVEIRQNLGLSYYRLGDLISSISDPDEAAELFRKTLAIGQELSAKDPNNAQASRIMLTGYIKLAELTLRKGNPAGSIEIYSKALAIGQGLASKDRTNAQAQRDLVVVYGNLSNAIAESGDIRGAIENELKGMSIQEELVAADPANTRGRRDLATFNLSIGRLHSQIGNIDQALNSYRKALDIIESLMAKDPKNAQVRADLARVLYLAAKLLGKRGEIEQARSYMNRALATQKELADRPEAHVSELYEYAWSLLTCEPVSLRDPFTALRYARQSVEVSQGKNPVMLKALALAYHQTGDHAKAIETAERALALVAPSDSGGQVSELRRELETELAKYRAALINRR